MDTVLDAKISLPLLGSTLDRSSNKVTKYPNQRSETSLGGLAARRSKCGRPKFISVLLIGLFAGYVLGFQCHLQEH